MASRSIDDYITILNLDKLNHQQRDQIFTNRDLPPYADGLLVGAGPGRRARVAEHRAAWPCASPTSTRAWTP
jgi:hypothetical protein